MTGRSRFAGLRLACGLRIRRQNLARSMLNALARAITSCGSEMSAGVILSTTSMAV
jgi:hypothetical protein